MYFKTAQYNATIPHLGVLRVLDDGVAVERGAVVHLEDG